MLEALIKVWLSSYFLSVLPYLYRIVFILIMLIYNHNQREEKKREVMESEVMLQRMQMKYKVHVFFCILIVLNLLTIKSWSLVLIPVFAWNLDWIAFVFGYDLRVRIQNLFIYIWYLLNIGKSMRIFSCICTYFRIC